MFEPGVVPPTMRIRVALASLLGVGVLLALAVFGLRVRSSEGMEFPSAVPESVATDPREALALEGSPIREARTILGAVPRAESPAPEPPSETQAAEKALGTLRVFVVDPWDRPAQCAVTVRAVPLDGSRQASDSRLGPDDPVEIRMPLGVPHRIEVEPIRSDRWTPASYEPAHAGGAPVKVILPTKLGRISGRVCAEECGDPVAGAGLVAFLESEDLHAVEVVGLGEGGTFDFLFHAGEVELEASGPQRENRSVRVPLRPGEWVSDIRVALSLAPHRVLRGRVVDDAGAPVLGASLVLSVFARRETGGGGFLTAGHAVEEKASGSDGAFRFEIPAGDEHLLGASAEWHEPTGPILLDLSSAENEIEIVLARAGALRVRGLLPDGSPWIPATVALARGGETLLVATLRRDRLAGNRFGIEDRWPRLERPTRFFRAFGAVRGSGAAAAREGEESAPPSGEGGFVLLEGVVPGEIEATLRDGTLEGMGTAFVVAGETTTVEVSMRRVETASPR